MKRFYIPELRPLEDGPRDYSLRFLTQVWRNFGNFKGLRKNPFIWEAGGEKYIEDGNHRCIFLAINGIDYIEADSEVPDEDKSRVIALTKMSSVDRLSDLVKMLQNPLLYSINGPVTHKITLEQLQDKKYWLNI